MCTSAAGEHPYAGRWWPDAHVLGYEHGFVNMPADILRALGGEKPVVPLPDFEDAYETQRVLEAALRVGQGAPRGEAGRGEVSARPADRRTSSDESVALSQRSWSAHAGARAV